MKTLIAFIGRHPARFTIASLILGALGIFWLPWSVPMSQQVESHSYIYGFNNFAAHLVIAILLGVLFAIGWCRKVIEAAQVPPRVGKSKRARQTTLSRSRTQELLGKLLVQEPDDAGASRKLLVSFVVLSVLMVIMEGVLFYLLPYDRYGESGNRISELDLMAMGLRPYRDFQFNYGPAMVYPIFWLYKLAHGHLSIEAAYGFLLPLHWVAGLFLLYYIVRSLGGKFSKWILFLLIGLELVNLTLGVIYTPLRYLIAVASVIYLHRRFISCPDDVTKPIKVACLAFFLPLLSLAVSPEFGLASVAGISAYFITLAFTPLRKWSVFAVLPMLSVLGALLVFSQDYLEGVFTFGSGGNSYPIVPTIHIVLFLGAALWVLPQLAVFGVTQRNERGACAIALVVCTGILIPASLSRCDGGHVYANGLGIFILYLALALQLKDKVISYSLTGLYLVIYLIVGYISHFSGYGQNVKAALQVRRQILDVPGFDWERNRQAWESAANASGEILYGRLLPFSEDLSQLLKYKKIGMPLPCDEDIEHFIKLSGRYVPEYYAAYTPGEITTHAHIERKLHDMEKMDVILVPKYYFAQRQNARSSDYYRSDMAFLQGQLMFPISLRERNPRLLPEMRIVDEIMKHYQPVEEFRGSYFILSRRQS